jgi:phosphoribosylaminoimidazolecarboxamide formyltransferase / IMP cyclohydrolase
MAACWRCATTPTTPPRWRRTASPHRPAGGQPLPVRGDRGRRRAFDDCIENIDIGGPAMLRARRPRTTPSSPCVTDPADYAALLAELDATAAPPRSPSASASALAAYARTAAYDAAISSWFAGALGDDRPGAAFAGRLRPGPCATARTRTSGPPSTPTGEARPGVATARQLQGKELSYNNINDTDAAFELVAEFDPATAPPCAIIKHANPCGVAWRRRCTTPTARPTTAIRTSAFGGIVALNRPRRRDRRAIASRSSPRW